MAILPNQVTIAADISHLQYSFQRKQTLTFETFLQVWEALQFSKIHYAIRPTAKDLRGHHLRNLYSSVMNFLSQDVENRFEVTVFAIYTLFMLYQTQICEPKELIPVPYSILKRFYEAGEKSKAGALLEVAYILETMSKQNIFLYCVNSSKKISKPSASFFPSSQQNLSMLLDEPSVNVSNDVILSTEFSAHLKTFANLIKPSAFSSLLSLAHNYDSVKKNISSSISSSPTPLHLTDSSLYPLLYEKFTEFHSLQKTRLFAKIPLSHDSSTSTSATCSPQNSLFNPLQTEKNSFSNSPLSEEHSAQNPPSDLFLRRQKLRQRNYFDPI